ncbi:hypothetical protein AHMF7605_28370 [Adhaeribacter arboris]|uniref:BDI-0842-like domain-containing protein n=1 Tax=Adhaeribacter arboris TaxID=2072846 RepID=A0A2T2YNP7_9BACT|nr:hypothetical protein [Adhaeribacter arboris]PSR57116.1 hypothetical protein AHMF7605_28370 [Adhaeribacter arboris]
MRTHIVLTAILVVVGLLYTKKKSLKFWLAVLSLVILANLGTYLARRILKTRNQALPENTHKLSRNTFIASLKENPEVVRAIYTEQGYLAITVANDGQDKHALATYFCDLAKSQDVFISGVKILDSADTKFGRSYAYGTELGEANCH